MKKQEVEMRRIFAMTIGIVLVFAALAAAQTNPGPGPQPPAVGRNFVDADGDGICDRFQAGTPGQGQGRQTGPRDGTGQKLRRGGGQGLGAGSGVGPASGARPGSAACDGTGPKGRGRGGR